MAALKRTVASGAAFGSWILHQAEEGRASQIEALASPCIIPLMHHQPHQPKPSSASPSPSSYIMTLKRIASWPHSGASHGTATLARICVWRQREDAASETCHAIQQPPAAADSGAHHSQQPPHLPRPLLARPSSRSSATPAWRARRSWAAWRGTVGTPGAAHCRASPQSRRPGCARDATCLCQPADVQSSSSVSSQPPALIQASSTPPWLPCTVALRPPLQQAASAATAPNREQPRPTHHPPAPPAHQC